MSRTRRSWTLMILGLLTACGLLVYACGGGGGGSPTAPSPSPSVVTVEVNDDFYEPKSITIDPGDTVRWVMNGSNSGHTVTHRDGAFDSGFVFNAAGDSFRRTFGAGDNGKTFEYSCRTHKDCCNMQGSVRVGAGAPDPDPGY